MLAILGNIAISLGLFVLFRDRPMTWLSGFNMGVAVSLIIHLFLS